MWSGVATCGRGYGYMWARVRPRPRPGANAGVGAGAGAGPGTGTHVRCWEWSAVRGVRANGAGAFFRARPSTYNHKQISLKIVQYCVPGENL